MSGATKRIFLPLGPGVAASLRAGEIITLSGDVLVFRDEVRPSITAAPLRGATAVPSAQPDPRPPLAWTASPAPSSNTVSS
jgi:hypothetical protein